MNRHQHLYLGIDGGGTKCKVRLEDAKGNLLAEAISGPANAARDLQGTISSIRQASMWALEKADIDGENIQHLYVGAGIAGVNIPSVKQALAQWKHPFANFNLTTDLHIACMGAHNGLDGAIIITGTGSSGASFVENQYRELGGHGFVAGDKGSGAWMGKKAIAHTLEVMDGLAQGSKLSTQVQEQLCCNTTYDLVNLSLQAKPSFYAQLAPLVLQLANEDDPVARPIIEDGANYISALAAKLLESEPPRLSIIGGVSRILQPWLARDIQQKISPALSSPEAGAILLAKSNLSVRETNS